VRKRTVSNWSVGKSNVSNRTVRNLMCLIARWAIATCPIVLCANEPLPTTKRRKKQILPIGCRNRNRGQYQPWSIGIPNPRFAVVFYHFYRYWASRLTMVDIDHDSDWSQLRTPRFIIIQFYMGLQLSTHIDVLSVRNKVNFCMVQHGFMIFNLKIVVNINMVNRDSGQSGPWHSGLESSILWPKFNFSTFIFEKNVFLVN